MSAHKYNIREICGDWALDIHWGNKTIALFFNSRNNAELVKTILEWEDNHPNAAVPYKPTLTQPNEPLVTGFDVVDTKTGEYPDLEKIALKEDWAKHLMYCDMEGFAIEEDGTLLLLDECGRQACCPVGRFEIRRPPEGEEET